MGDQDFDLDTQARVDRILDRIDRAAQVIESLGRAIKELTRQGDAQQAEINRLQGVIANLRQALNDERGENINKYGARLI